VLLSNHQMAAASCGYFFKISNVKSIVKMDFYFFISLYF
jgi:hypothetical protein